MSSRSARAGFLDRSSIDESDYFESLIQIARTQYKPHRIGQKFHGSLARTRLNMGGLGSGKTRMMSEHINALCLEYPGSLHLIGRRDLPSLKETTQREYLEKVVSPETIAGFHVNDNKLYYKNGSAVLFRETKEPDKVKSLELTSYGLDEADENPTSEIWEKLDDRLRQKIFMDGEWVEPPYAGILTYNPTPEDFWLYELAHRKDISVELFQSSTYDNVENLPKDYIPNLLKKLPPWEVSRLVFGNWGRSIKGKPVYFGFSYENNVRHLKVNGNWPLLRGWDFGYGRPAVRWMQIDPWSGRCFLLREFLGCNQMLNAVSEGRPSVIDEVKRITEELVGPGYPIFDYCDPHGADKKDNAESSVETLRRHFGIHCIYRRERIVTGIEEIQSRILDRSPLDPTNEESKVESLWLVDHSCKISIALYMGGYHREDDGTPKKDGYYDHLADVDRYVLVNNMNLDLVRRAQAKRRGFRPKNSITGY